jgi:N-acetylmuramic acid 6-phosphate etherase
MTKSTENDSLYKDLDKMDSLSLLKNINAEDKKVAVVIEELIPKIAQLVDLISERMQKGGRLFYIGAGTSGRLGIVDASECPPTFGVPHGMVVGIIAGGDAAIRKAVEFAEDDTNQAWLDLKEHEIDTNDTLIGIAASGSTPYVIGGIKKAREKGLLTACICCNQHSPLAEAAEYPIEAVVGPEFVTGSTRMKSGTAQKLILNMISTAVMIKLGRVIGNKMVDMQLSNNKLIDRGTRMLMNELNVDYEKANQLLISFGSVRQALNSVKNEK